MLVRSTRIWIPTALAVGLAAPAALASTFTQLSDGGEITAVPAPAVDALLTEGGLPSCTPPAVSFTLADLGLVPGDEIDALSFGDDPIAGSHVLTFSVDEFAVGDPSTGVDHEVTTGTAPSCPLAGANPPEATGDVFEQIPYSTNRLATAPRGYDMGPTGTGDEWEAAWATPSTGPRDDLDGFDYSEVPTPGLYFSLAAGSPSLAGLGATPGDILFVIPGAGAPTFGPVIAILLGVGPATDVTLGIAGEDLDALNLVQNSPGVIATGPLGASNWEGSGPGCCVISSHLVQFSVAPGGAFLPGDVLTRSVASPAPPAPGIAGVHTLGYEGLGLHPALTDNLNALEAHAGKLNWEGEFRLTLGYNDPFVITGVGVANVNSSAGLGHQTTLTFDGGGLTLTTTVPYTDPHLTTTMTTMTMTTTTNTLIGLSLRARPGTAVMRTFPGPLATNTLPVPGQLRFCMLTPGCSGAVGVPLTLSGTRGFGIGGTINTTPGSVAVSLMGAPWTPMTTSIPGFPTSNGGTTTLTTMGFVHGPASLTSSTALPGGVFQLVTPLFVHAIVPPMSTPRILHGFGILTLHYTIAVPEPGSFLMLVSGAAGLLILGRRRMKP